MSHIGVICPPLPGHVNPLCALARALIRRGHRVTFFQVSDLGPLVRREDVDFIAVGTARFPPGALDRYITKLRYLQGLSSLTATIDYARRMAALILEDAPDALRGARVDALIVDQNEPAGATVAEYMKLPFVSACTSLPLNREPLIPPSFTGWTYADSTFARARNRMGYGIADALIRPIHGTMNQYRRRWGLRPLATPDDSFSRSAEVAQMPREFDFPRANLPATFHYCGPWFDSSSLRSDFPFEKLDGRPLIYGSLGTLQRKDSEHFRTIAAACAGLAVQLVLSLGPHEGPAPADLPGDPIVVDYAPQLKLLSRAALAITHAGMNTTQQALHYGVPLVAIPLAHDQPAIASRLARTGAGIAIRLRGLSVEALRNAILEVLPANSSYRWNARRLRAASEKAGGVERAAGIAEAALARGCGRGAGV